LFEFELYQSAHKTLQVNGAHVAVTRPQSPCAFKVSGNEKPRVLTKRNPASESEIKCTSEVKAGFHMIAAIPGKKHSAIVAIMWKPLFSDHSNHMETSLYGTAQRLKSQRPLNFFGSYRSVDHSDRMESSL